MKIGDVTLQTLKDPGLLEFIDEVSIILNDGRYQLRTVSSIPTWSGYEGEMVLYSAGTERGIYYYINGQWNASIFAAWTGQNLIQLGSGDNVIYGDTSTGFWIGNANFASAPFRVSMSGVLYAISGIIGGFTISSNSLTAGSGVSAVGLAPSTYPFYAGSDTPAVAPFRVSSTGAVTCSNITATGGAISGWTLTSSSMYAGSGSSYVGIDGGPYPFWAGSETASLAPFYVTNAGVVHASAIMISGLQTGSEIDGSYLKIGTVAANKIIVSDLSAISSNLGTVTAGTITAGTMQTSADPAVSRVKMDTNGLIGYDSVLGQTFKLPTDGSAPTFSSGIIYSATIINTTFVSSSFTTASELPYLQLTSSGLAYVETTAVGKYNTYKYGDGTKYGTGTAAWFGNSAKPMLTMESERTLADIRLYARSSEPSGAAVIGDIAFVSGTLRLCTSAGTPGTYKTVATLGLTGTKVYYAADSSGGAVTRKLTFTDGILTAET